MSIRANRLATLLCLLLALLAGCASTSGDRNQLESSLFRYAGAIRFNSIEAAYQYVDPKLREGKPMRALDFERYAQVQFTGYTVKASETPVPGELRQTVEVRLINIHTQVERVMTVQEHWRWDADARRWWLSSGLPDITPKG